MNKEKINEYNLLEQMNLHDKIMQYIKVRQELFCFAQEIWNYVLINFKNKLEYVECSYNDFYVNENWFTIAYEDEWDPYNGTSTIDIPMEIIYKNLWKGYLIKEFEENV